MGRPEHGDQANDADSENLLLNTRPNIDNEGNEDIEDLIFQSVLVMPEHARPHLTKIIGSYYSFHGQLQAKNHDNSGYKFSNKKHFTKIEKNHFEKNRGVFPQYNLHIHIVFKL